MSYTVWAKGEPRGRERNRIEWPIGTHLTKKQAEDIRDNINQLFYVADGYHMTKPEAWIEED